LKAGDRVVVEAVSKKKEGAQGSGLRFRF
jgi:hypothetical protein